MEHMGLVEGGCNVMRVLDYSSSHKAKTCWQWVQLWPQFSNHHLVLLVYRISIGGLNCYKPHNIIGEQVKRGKSFMWLMFHGLKF